jgi:hypothetical protein
MVVLSTASFLVAPRLSIFLPLDRRAWVSSVLISTSGVSSCCHSIKGFHTMGKTKEHGL